MVTSNLDYFTGPVFTPGKHWERCQRLGLMAWRRREALIDSLGGKCVVCGTKKKLEIDHINGRDWEPNKKSRWTRVVIYEREAKEGKLQVLCRSCNAKKGKKHG